MTQNKREQVPYFKPGDMVREASMGEQFGDWYSGGDDEDGNQDETSRPDCTGVITRVITGMHKSFAFMGKFQYTVVWTYPDGHVYNDATVWPECNLLLLARACARS